MIERSERERERERLRMTTKLDQGTYTYVAVELLQEGNEKKNKKERKTRGK